MGQHITILLDNSAKTEPLVKGIINNEFQDHAFNPLKNKLGKVFSKGVLNAFIDEEEYHGIKTLTANTSQALKSMSSGEQKKCLLQHLFELQPDYIILVRPFDHLDAASQAALKSLLYNQSNHYTFIFLVHRYADVLDFSHHYFTYQSGVLFKQVSKAALLPFLNIESSFLKADLPLTKHKTTGKIDKLVEFQSVSVNYQNKPILHQISWTVRSGEFWQLIGPNGSGKSTLISMITGDNPKAFGNDIWLFGTKKEVVKMYGISKKELGILLQA